MICMRMYKTNYVYDIAVYGHNLFSLYSWPICVI